MHYRGLHDTKGELFAYLEGDRLYSVDGELTGRLEGDFVVDTAGNRVWLVQQDGVYTLNGVRAIGYFSDKTPDD